MGDIQNREMGASLGHILTFLERQFDYRVSALVASFRLLIFYNGCSWAVVLVFLIIAQEGRNIDDLLTVFATDDPVLLERPTWITPS